MKKIIKEPNVYEKVYDQMYNKMYKKVVRTSHLLVLIVLSLVFLGSGCLQEKDSQVQIANSIDPVNALQSYQFSSKYTDKFWQIQKKNNSEVWRYAIVFCEGHPEYPNCFTVEKARKTN